MNISVSRGFVTELLKDIVYPEVCPICGDIIPTARRIAYHRALAELPKPGNSADGHYTDSAHISYKNHYPPDNIYIYPYKTQQESKQNADIYSYDFSKYYQGLVCDPCFKILDFIETPYCLKCGKPLSVDAASAMNNIFAVNESGPGLKKGIKGQDAGTFQITSLRNTNMLCSDCRTHERSFIQCRALLSYDERMRDIMADVKYNGRKEYLKLFGILAADRLGAWIRNLGITCLIPVPVHASRLKSRGYNQSELLCEYISNLTHIPVRNDILIRNKKTAAQKELNVDERLLNLQSAFKAAGQLPLGSIAMIVDDIYTTGSTMEACTERIKEAGAAKVYGLTICIGEDKDR